MNIVIVNDSASVNGGASKVALTEALALAKMGHIVHLITAFGMTAPELRNVNGLHVHSLGICDINVDPNRFRSASMGLWNPRSYSYVADLLNTFNPNETVVHAHSWTRGLSSSVLKAAVDRRVEVVLTLHDYLMGCPQGTFFNQVTSEPCILKPMGSACLSSSCDSKSYFNKLWRTGRKLVQDRIAGVPGNIRHFIYVSESSLNQLRPYLPAGSSLHELKNPIEVSRTKPLSVDRNELFCFAGRLVPEKGALVFAKAALAQQVRARFIGDGPQRDEIQRILPRAEVTGWLSSEDTANALCDARALVFPSLWNEVLGLTVLEAAAKGIPSIVPRGCGAAESVVDSETGLHFASGDAQDLASKMKLMKTPGFAGQLGRAAYERFWSIDDWGVDAHARHLETIYQSILKDRRDRIDEVSLRPVPQTILSRTNQPDSLQCSEI